MLRIQQLNTQAICRAHRSSPGRVFTEEEILPDGICPWLYHSVYPYFLALIYGARFDFNEYGDVHVCCPAADGVDCIVRKRENDGTFGEKVGSNVQTLAFAEIVRAGACPHGHRIGQRYVFPSVMKDHYLCPAGLNNLFPLLRLEPPSCIDRNRIRCPDWKDTILFNIDENERKA